MWSFYGIELSDVSVTRAALLLRILVVDTQPFQSLLAEQFEGQDDWQMRYVLRAAVKEITDQSLGCNRCRGCSEWFLTLQALHSYC